MSLSTWLRDCLYVPLGGNRGATVAAFLLAPGSAGFIYFRF